VTGSVPGREAHVGDRLIYSRGRIDGEVNAANHPRVTAKVIAAQDLDPDDLGGSHPGDEDEREGGAETDDGPSAGESPQPASIWHAADCS
jgi:hypothetical protein